MYEVCADSQLGEFVNGSDPGDCKIACDANSSCVAFAFFVGANAGPNTPRCSLKSNKPGVYANIGTDTDWNTYVRGTCAQGTAHSESSSVAWLI